ncbi:bifunctional 2-polyprenyl-6-hydroxyphenol methylase/3-demethylubiquinol 3-O-methyltransferase UbiG [Rhizobacter sp. Root404]|uniref:class I SAM-dependent methyltransferase n=1 Tax=Rhizobacter sp. Root404 TaxID=1736528 RepID=UPI0006F242E8|nr:class I SAM-dependent methyltransferase [Rhizobacter sp. Root404]KQW38241.1 methyltransferase [Rhizobacter sp. Root404]
MNDANSKYTVQRHSQFGFLQVSPTPSAQEITRFYAEEFYSAKYKAFNNSALEVQEADREFHDAHRQDIVDTVERLSGRPLAGQFILDIGCGWGQAMRYFASKGAQCFGFDPATEAVDYVRSRGLECVRAGMERMDVFGDRRFDVVTLMNVLEHLADPVAVISEIRAKVLAPNGLLVIEVPNEFNAFQVAGQKLYSLEPWWLAPPAHLNYFSASTLSDTLRGTGFVVRHLEASFPMEMFLLMGDNYVADKACGRACHERRMAFEMNLRAMGMGEKLRDFYAAMAQVDLGRQVIAYASEED